MNARTHTPLLNIPQWITRKGVIPPYINQQVYRKNQYMDQAMERERDKGVHKGQQEVANANRI